MTTPIVQTAAYTFQSTEELFEYLDGRRQSYKYGRDGNPTVRVLEEKIKEIEGAEDCLMCSSGMNAVSTMVMSLVPSGGHVVMTADCSTEMRRFAETILANMSIGISIIDPLDMKGLSHILETQDVDMILSESPTRTAHHRCIDIAAVRALCDSASPRTLLVIDSTCATPIHQKAIALGADLVIHSATGYLCGHHDVLAGALTGRAELVDLVRRMRHVLGGTLDAHAAYLVIRGMKTLDVRVGRQNATALEIARRLLDHPKVSKVHYPGLECHPDHAIAKSQMHGFGGVLSFEVDARKTRAVVDALKVPYIAASCDGIPLGGVESLVLQPSLVNPSMPDTLIQYSCGIEPLEDIWSDLSQSISKAT